MLADLGEFYMHLASENVQDADRFEVWFLNGLHLFALEEQLTATEHTQLTMDELINERH